MQRPLGQLVGGRGRAVCRWHSNSVTSDDRAKRFSVQGDVGRDKVEALGNACREATGF